MFSLFLGAKGWGAGMTNDPVMADIKAAIALLHGGDRAAAREGLQAIWQAIAANAQPIHECTLAHYMADAQQDITEELAWDIRALAAAERCTDADARQHSQAASIAAFMPSLHLNLGEDYFKLGNFARAREHAASAHAFIARLADDAYGQLIRRGVERLQAKLTAAP